jgi:hypothetical protein
MLFWFSRLSSLQLIRPLPMLPWRHHPIADDGMSTAEYAIGTIAAAAFAAVLYTVVTGDNVITGLTALVQRALSVNF